MSTVPRLPHPAVHAAGDIGHCGPLTNGLHCRMRIATWNVNSIKQRMDNILAWLADRQPDIACLQETKCVDEAFPRAGFEALGYNVAVHGQKAFNGVAILSKTPFDEVTPRLPGDDDDMHARFLEAVVSTNGGIVRVASIYLPNGNPPDGEKYSYKLKWMDRLIHYAHERLALEEPLVMAGDYNVIPTAAMSAIRRPGWVTPCTCRGPGRSSARCAILASRTRCAPAATRADFTPSGTTRPAPGRRMTASGSTTSCSRRKPPTGW